MLCSTVVKYFNYEEINPYKIAARFMIDNQNESGFCKPNLSKGKYEIA